MSVKVSQIVGLMQHRLGVGAYSLQQLPSERALAVELGVSYMTARKAVQRLKEMDVWHLKPAIPESSKKKQLQIAFLHPAYESTISTAWLTALSQAVVPRDGVVRPVTYVEWSDPVIFETLNAPFDGIFMIPPPMPKLPPLLAKRLSDHRDRLVTLFSNYTELGIPCVDLGAPLFLKHLVKHLVDLGHRKLGCINTQPMSPVIEQRIAAWNQAATDAGCSTVTYNEPVEPFEDPGTRAYSVARRLMDAGKFQDCTAYFSTLTLSASGIIRAAYERGVRIGIDVSLCSCDAPERARLLTPSLTTLQYSNRSLLCERALKWITSRGEGWNESLWIVPDDTPVVLGESTGPCPASNDL
ncbi:MAG: yvoA [Phycisphaerales bacterium]|nr:yvoA [Phycisphaerales bacterium]